MKLLVLGGTRFLGRHIVQQALDTGHQVTLLHRGRSSNSSARNGPRVPRTCRSRRPVRR